MFSFARPCPRCGGSGRAVTTPCANCSASGIEQRVDEVKVKVPAGIADGARIRLRGHGGAIPGGDAGDLYVVVHVEPHPVLGRSGSDLTLTVPLTYPQLVLGSNVSVPTLEEPVTLKVPAGTQPGRTFRVRGRGLPRTKGGGSGDLLVTVTVRVPTDPTPEERELIEKLAALGDDARAEVRT